MRTYLLFIYTLTVFTSFSLFAKHLTAIEPERIKKEDALQKKVMEVILDKTSSPSFCIQENLRLEKSLSDFPYKYVKTMDTIISLLEKRASDAEIYNYANQLAKTVAFLKVDHLELDGYRLLEIRCVQADILMRFPLRLKKTSEFIDCDPDERAARIMRVLNLYRDTMSLMDISWDPYKKENILDLHGFVPPESFEGHTIGAGADYTNSKDEATRKSYEKYNDEQHKRNSYRNIQLEVRNIQKKLKIKIPAFLIDAYSLFPYRTAELEQMLTERKVDHEMAKAILDAVRKAERENPDEGFRIWLSKDKLFKAEAKFVSANQEEVTLENKDGKQSTIELSALRKEDQEYVQQQLITKPKKPEPAQQ